MIPNHADVVQANIRAEAARLGLRHRDLAPSAGLSVEAFSRRMRGSVPFTVDQVRSLAVRLGVSVTSLIEPIPAATA